MNYRKLGTTGIRVSEVGLGTWSAGGSVRLGGVPTGYGDVPASEVERAVHRGLDLGVSFFDTSDSYGLGRAERLLGAALRDRRGQVVLATKIGWVPDGAERWVKDVSPDHLRSAAARSRARLDVDVIDVLQLHALPEEGEETDAALDALDELKAAEVCRFVGVSAGQDVDAALRLVRTGRVDVVQVPYNLFQQQAAAELFEEAEVRGVGVIASSPLAHGFLAGRYTRSTRFDADDWRSQFKPDELAARVERVDVVRFLTGHGGRTLLQSALQFVLAHPAVATAIPGFRSREQVEELAAAIEAPPLNDIELARARELGRSRHRPVASTP